MHFREFISENHFTVKLFHGVTVGINRESALQPSGMTMLVQLQHGFSFRVQGVWAPGESCKARRDGKETDINMRNK